MTLFRDRYRVESARLKGWDYRSRGWYFVTICTAQGRSYFGRITNGELRLSEIGVEAERQLLAIGSHYENVVVDGHIVMPNHVHMIVVIEGRHRFSPATEPVAARIAGPPKAGSLAAIVRSYKAGVTRWCRENAVLDFAWQARFYDHILRSNAGIAAAKEYMVRNPANWLDDSLHPLSRAHGSDRL